MGKKLKSAIMAFMMSLLLVGMIPSLPYGTVMQSFTVQAASSVKLNKSKATLIQGKTLQLKISGSTKKVTWSSSNKKIATVTSKGKVAAKAKGTATITATVSGKKYTCKITVEAPKLNKKTLTKQTGETYTLKMSGTTQKVTWKSSNKSVATVSSKGKVTAKAKGTATITATVGNKKYTCKVTVKKAASKSVLSVSSQNIVINNTGNVTVTYTANTGSVSYHVENPDIASCEWNKTWSGDKITLKIYGEKVGSTNIIITNTYNSEKCIVKVTVNKVAPVSKHDLAMAAFGISQAYYSAKFPSTLHINQIQYEKNFTTGYGDTISRMVLRCYAQNTLGGYNYFYIVVIKCISNTHYPNATLYDNYYISTSTHSSDPGMHGNILDNKTAMDAYHNIYGTNSKDIMYD